MLIGPLIWPSGRYAPPTCEHCGKSYPLGRQSEFRRFLAALAFVISGLWITLTILIWALPLDDMHHTLVQVIASQAEWFWQLLHRIV